MEFSLLLLGRRKLLVTLLQTQLHVLQGIGLLLHVELEGRAHPLLLLRDQGGALRLQPLAHLFFEMRRGMGELALLLLKGRLLLRQSLALRLQALS